MSKNLPHNTETMVFGYPFSTACYAATGAAFCAKSISTDLKRTFDSSARRPMDHAVNAACIVRADDWRERGVVVPRMTWLERGDMALDRFKRFIGNGQAGIELVVGRVPHIDADAARDILAADEVRATYADRIGMELPHAVFLDGCRGRNRHRCNHTTTVGAAFNAVVAARDGVCWGNWGAGDRSCHAPGKMALRPRLPFSRDTGGGCAGPGWSALRSRSCRPWRPPHRPAGRARSGRSARLRPPGLAPAP